MAPRGAADKNIKGADGVRSTPPVSANCKPQSPAKKWWQEPSHLIQACTLLFVGGYTVLTVFLLLTSRDTEQRQFPVPNSPLPATFTFADSPASGFYSKGDLGNGKHRDGDGAIPKTDLGSFQAVIEGRGTLYLYGHIDYCDVFGTPRETGFCFVYVPNVGEELPLCDRHNSEIEAHHGCG